MCQLIGVSQYLKSAVVTHTHTRVCLIKGCRDFTINIQTRKERLEDPLKSPQLLSHAVLSQIRHFP